MWGRPLSWVLNNLAAADLVFLAALHGLEPFGPRQDEARAGEIAAAAANAWGARVRPCDFFPSLKPPAGRDGTAAGRNWMLARCPALAAVRPTQIPRVR